jgi:methyl-accepting chemotaxis protein
VSINRLVSSAILLISFFMAILGGYVTLTKLNTMRELTAAGQRLDVIRAVGNIPKFLNPERSVISIFLQTGAPGEQGKLGSLAESQAASDGAVAIAAAKVAEVQGQLDDGEQVASQMRDIQRLLKQLRQFGEEKMRLPIAERGDLVDTVNDMGQAVNNVVSQVLSDQLRRLADGGGEPYRNVSLADRTWALRDVAGFQGGIVNSFIAVRKPVTAEQRKYYYTLEGKVQQAWSALTPLLDEASTPVLIKTSLSAAKSSYFEWLGELKKKAENAFDTGDFPLDPAMWRSRSLPTWLKILALRDAFYDIAASEIGDARSTARLEAILAALVLLAAFSLAAGVLVVVKRRVTAPIAAMTSAMGRIAEGEFGAAIPGAGRTDEIGKMAEAVVVFRDAGLAKLARDREIEEERLRGEEQRRLAEAEAIDRERSMVTRSIGAGLAKLAAQDLAYRMTDDLPGAYQRLQADFNQAMQQLEEAMTGVARNVHAIEAGSQQITSAADDLSRHTEQQAASQEETSASLEEVTVTVDKTADGARHASEMVGAAKVDAEKGSEIVRVAIEAMINIEKSSKQISQIIGVIDEIAFQTNLLALNAGVEAARAGDAGRGFAVVAQEVRALAQRSAEAAKEIKSLISTSTAQVNQGVGLVRDSGEALRRIVVQIADVNKVVAEIAAGAREQATGLKEVSAAVNQMDQVTQRNAAMVEETTAASHSLLQEAGDLLAAVSCFQVTGNRADEAQKAAARPPRRAGAAARG